MKIVQMFHPCCQLFQSFNGMGRRREYLPIGKNEALNTYHRSYDRYRIQSNILNGGGRHPGIDTVFWDKTTVLNEIALMAGDEKGMTYSSSIDGHTLATIPKVKEQLRRLEKRFKNYQQQKVNEGHSRPKEMPKEMLEERLQLEARLDVLNEELRELNKRLEVIKNEEEQEHNQLLLANGVASSSSLMNGIVREIDGQNVSLNANSVLIIDDALSPYDGLLVADYRVHISTPWRMATDRLRNEKAALSRQLISKGLYEERFKAEWEQLRQKLINENGWADLFAMKLAGKPAIPKVPDKLKNYKKVKAVL